MADNSTQREAPTGPKSGTIIVAIIVPSVLIIVLLALIFVNRRRGFFLPRLVRDELVIKENRWKSRQEELEMHIKSQDFYDWMESQKEKKPGFHQATDPLCAICLEDFSEDAQIRGLRCSHAYHSRCLDEWFTRYNEHCPLCHRPIIPGSRAARKKAREEPEATLPVMFMV